MHLCIFLVEARFNQFSTQKVSFEVFFCNIIWAAQFCRQCNSLQHPSEIFPPRNIRIVKWWLQELSVYLFRGFQCEAWLYTRQKP